MSQINPFGGYAAGGTQAIRRQEADRDIQARRIRRKSRNTGSPGEESEPQVDNADELPPIDYNQPRQQEKERPRHRRSAPPADQPSEPSHLDITG